MKDIDHFELSSSSAKNLYSLPVVPFTELGKKNALEENNISLSTEIPISNEAFAVKVNMDTLLPVISNSSYVIVEPKQQIKANSKILLVKSDGEYSFIFSTQVKPQSTQVVGVVVHIKRTHPKDAKHLDKLSN